MSDLPNFKQLRNDPAHHLGLGDVRLTIAQQDAIDAENERLRTALKAIVHPRSGFGYSEDLRKVALAALEGDDE